MTTTQQNTTETSSPLRAWSRSTRIKPQGEARTPIESQMISAALQLHRRAADPVVEVCERVAGDPRLTYQGAMEQVHAVITEVAMPALDAARAEADRGNAQIDSWTYELTLAKKATDVRTELRAAEARATFRSMTPEAVTAAVSTDIGIVGKGARAEREAALFRIASLYDDPAGKSSLPDSYKKTVADMLLQAADPAKYADRAALVTAVGALLEECESCESFLKRAGNLQIGAWSEWKKDMRLRASMVVLRG